MKLVKTRVSDGAILALIKQFLRVPVIEEDGSGKKKTIPNESKIEFLGFELSERISRRTGRRYIHCQPSKKSRQKFRDKVREELNHWTKWRDTDEAIRRVNRITRGWGELLPSWKQHPSL